MGVKTAVYKYDLEGSRLATYDSLAQACRDNNLNHTYGCSVIRLERCVCHTYYLSHNKTFDPPKKKANFNPLLKAVPELSTSWYKKKVGSEHSKWREVQVFNLNGELEMTLSGLLKEIAAELKKSPDSVRFAIKRGSVLDKKWFIKIKRK